MTPTITKERRNVLSGNGRSLDGGSGPWVPFQSHSDPGSESKQIGLLFFMATVTMLFGGIVSSLLIRRSSSDWQAIYMPSILWVNTGILLSSSLMLEFARSAEKRLAPSMVRFWMTLATLLGLAFLFGQVMAWMDMAKHGVFLPSSPHASFFYLFTGLHALHLLGGLLVLVFGSLKLSAMYWHFLTVLWIILFAVIFVL